MICAGIAGGLNGTGVGQVVVADQIVFAGLGAETPDGFRPLSALGFDTSATRWTPTWPGNSHIEPEEYSAPC